MGTAYSFQPSASDPDGDVLSYSIQNRPTWAAFNTTTGALTGTPTTAGTASNIIISASDGKSSVSLAAFAIVISQPANGAPTISGTPATTATVGSAYNFQPSASDPDGEVLSYSIQNRPTWAAFNTTTGALTGTPTTAGTASNIILSASDGKSSVSLAAFAIVVTQSANGTPTISGTPPTTATVGTAYSFQPSASEPDGDELFWSISNKPSWAIFSTTTGNLSGTPASANAGAATNIAISVSDGKGSVSLAAFAIVVSLPANGTPTISGTPAATATIGSAYSFHPSASDPESDELFWSISNKPSWAIFSTTTGNLSGTPSSANAGVATNIAISVSDGKAAAVLAPFTIAVVPAGASSVQRSAGLTWEAPTQNVDDSLLSDLAGFRIVYGTSPSELTQTIDVPGPGSLSYTVDSLTSATWFFAVRAYTANGAESALSNIGSKTVP